MANRLGEQKNISLKNYYTNWRFYMYFALGWAVTSQWTSKQHSSEKIVDEARDHKKKKKPTKALTFSPLNLCCHFK